VERLRLVLKAKVMDIVDIDVLGQLKDFVLLFVKTMKSYGYETGTLLEFVAVVLRDRYLEIAAASVLTSARTSVTADSFASLVYKSEREVREQVLALGLEKTLDAYRSAQLAFPFSKLVPECVALLDRFIQNAATFSRGDIELPDMDRLLIRTTETLLLELPKLYTDHVLGLADLTVAQTATAYANMLTLQRALPLLAATTHRCGIGASAVKLSAKAGFEYAYRNIELKLQAVIEQYVVAAMKKAADATQWLATKANKEPRDYVKELVLFGSEALPKQLELLPKEQQQAMLRRYYAAIAEEFQKLLSRKTVERFNRLCVGGLLVDLEAIVLAANAAPVKGLAQDFLESQQLFVLLCEENIGEFLDAKVRAAKYSQLRNWRRLQLVFARYQDSQALNNVLGISLFTSDRHKAVEAIKAFIASQIK